MLTFLHAVCGNADKERTTRAFAGNDWKEIRLDSSKEAKPDVEGSLLEMSGVQSGSCDAVFTSHSLERLYPHEVMTALANISRVLNNDGYLVLTCSDLQAACALAAEDKLLEPAYESAAGPVAPLDIIYGFRPALAAGNVSFANRTGFTSRALVGTLARAGFASIWTARNPQIFTLAAIASKTERSEAFMRELAGQHFG